MEKQSVGIGLIGLGIVAGQVARVLTEKANLLAEQAGCPVVLRKIKVLPQDMSRPQVAEMDAALFTTDDDQFFNTPGIDIIVEAIGGEQPALEYLRRALSGGRYVVTSNKEVVAKHAAELLSLARENGVELRCEASVGGGIPLISPFQYDLVANEIKGIYAIINGTTNYILTRMDKDGLDFASALGQAQQLGYAEADPTNDVEGIDAVYKLAILASLAFKCQVRPDDIYREGISRLSARDFRYAREFGFAIKLLAIAKQSDGSLEVRVHPVFLPQDSFLAKVDGVYNAVLAEGDLVGKVIFLGEGAGPLPTSSAVVADVVQAAIDVRRGTDGVGHWRIAGDVALKPMAQVETRYYFRLSTADTAGVLAQIAQVLGDNRISISSAIQKEADSATQTAEIVLMTHPASESAAQKALAGLERLSVVREVSNLIRVED
ncbi:MAG: homoserine dehydrogenase [Dehalococcoidales bacterium]